MGQNTAEHRTQNALLTAAHRQFLPDQENYFTGEHAAQMRSEKRREIVDRVRHGLLDFPLLFEHLREDDLAAVFNEEETATLERAVQYAIAFLHEGITDEMGPRPEAHRVTVNDEGGHLSPEFESALEAGLRSGYRRRDYLLESARLDVRSQGPIDDLEDVLDKLASGTASKEEILYVLQTVDLPSKSIQEEILEAVIEQKDIEYPDR